MQEWAEYAKFFAGLLAIVNPVGAIPVFIGLTEGLSAHRRHRTALLSASAVGAVLLAALFTGEAILGFFGITIASFRVGGGILILLIAISMMHARLSPAKQTDEEAQDAAEKESVAVVPLAIPLLAGPGAISTIIVYTHRSSAPMHYALLGLEILLMALIVWLVFRAAPLLSQRLGRTGINVLTRIMGLILAAIAVEFMANGLRQLLPGLA
ncbi:MAG: amino acid transporter [Gammaproteobacteria bacterium HGW-Gammaproteobacteria-1]|jgi:multiple antibiotic resistance protein|nr:MAG: amino acid transporter [Gammaproteobacteria bacterium HGW-Gammaproteobacteria-1]